MAAPVRSATATWRPSGPKTRRFRFGLQPRPDEDPPLSPGQILGEKYRVLRLIGEGGMGRVYEAEHVGLQRTLAIKLLRADRTGPEHLARFRQEAEAASRVGHPSIVEIYDFTQTPEGRVLLVMERLSGESLEDWLSRPGRLSEALPWMAELARGLHAAHRAGVVHRDVKPANLFLHRTGDRVQPKILDFGIAKVSQTDHTRIETEVGTVLGTPYYLAPERALGRPLDPRADLYSLGVILYELLVGNVPFDDSTFMGIVGKHVKAQPLDPRQAAPERTVPDGVAMLVMALLAKEPSQRPATGAVVAQWIDRLLLEERAAIEAHRTGPREVSSLSDQATVSLDDVAARPTTAPVDAPTTSGARWIETAEVAGMAAGPPALTPDDRQARSIPEPRGNTELVGPMSSFAGGSVIRTRFETSYPATPSVPPAVRSPLRSSGSSPYLWVGLGIGALAGLAVALAVLVGPEESSSPANPAGQAEERAVAGPPSEVADPRRPTPAAPVASGEADGKTAPTGESSAPAGPTPKSVEPPPDPIESTAAHDESAQPSPRTPKPRRKTPREQTKSEPRPQADSGASLPAFKDEVYED